MPNCAVLIPAAALKLQTDFGGGCHRPKVARAAFPVCTDRHTPAAAADAFPSDAGETEQEGAAQGQARQGRGHVTQR